MRRAVWSLSVLFVSSSIAGCYAQAVSQDRFGGELVLADRSEESVNDAEQIMSDHCGPTNWRIEAWDTVERPSGNSTIEEYHLYYSCLRPTSPNM